MTKYIALLVLLFPAFGVTDETEAQETAKPNIIFIYADDMREDELPYVPQTTALLAEGGATFSNYYATFPLCCPSRATTFTGLYTHNHGVNSNLEGFRKFRERGHEANTVAVALDNAGYRTGLVGKYLNGYQNASHVSLGWDEWHVRLGSNDYNNFNLSDNGVENHYKGYETDVLAEKAEAFVREEHKPFFLYLAPSAPHGPSTPAERHKGLYGGNKRAASLLAVDEMVQRLVQALEETGELANTYVMFSSDNGWMLGEHGIHGGKKTFYEESASVPLLARGPGIPAGTVTQGLVGNHDLAPTFADIAGAGFTRADGRSFLPLLAGGEWRSALLLENPTPDRGPYKAVLKSGYKYVKKDGGDKLFDLANDPKEQTNIIGHADPAVVADLRATLEALKHCSGGSCRTAEDAN